MLYIYIPIKFPFLILLIFQYYPILQITTMWFSESTSLPSKFDWEVHNRNKDGIIARFKRVRWKMVKFIKSRMYLAKLNIDLGSQDYDKMNNMYVASAYWSSNRRQDILSSLNVFFMYKYMLTACMMTCPKLFE